MVIEEFQPPCAYMRVFLLGTSVAWKALFAFSIPRTGKPVGHTFTKQRLH